jgi:parvulin-like peptidyl-prolyl isomerase
MSASKERKTRRTGGVTANTSSQKEKQVKEEKQKDRMYRVISVVIAVVLIFSVGLIGFQAIVGSGLAAVNIGSEKVEAHEVNFYYFNVYSSFVNQYGDYLSMFGLNTSLPLKSQKYMGGNQTWHDYFVSSAINNLQEVKAYVNEAKSKGDVLSEASLTSIEEEMQGLADYVATTNMTVDYYLSASYGSKMTQAEYRRILSESYLARQYGLEMYNSFTYGEDSIESYYNENKKSLDLVDYRQFFFNGASENEEASDAEQSASMQNAHSLAEIMAGGISSEDDFSRLSLQNAAEDDKESYEDASATLRTGLTFSDAGSDVVAEWLFDGERKIGDVGVVDTTSGSYVLMYVNRYRHDYNTVDVRHILVQFETDEGAEEPTAEQKAAALETIEAIYDEWKNGSATEESFAALAVEKSEDPGSQEEGGLYEKVYKGQMVESFEDWSFDPDRKAGDTGIVETSYGYHLMYYVGENAPYWKVQVENVMRNADYDAYNKETREKYPVKQRTLGMMAVGLPNG